VPQIARADALVRVGLDFIVEFILILKIIFWFLVICVECVIELL
jgi:hypothetical protein